MIIGDPPELTVYAYDQYENPLEVPLYIDSEYVGTTGYSYTVSSEDHLIYVEDTDCPFRKLLLRQRLRLFESDVGDGCVRHDDISTMVGVQFLCVDGYYGDSLYILRHNAL